MANLDLLDLLDFKSVIETDGSKSRLVANLDYKLTK